MIFKTISERLKGQPQGQIAARSIAITGFATLTAMAVLEKNVVFAPLFFLLCLYYLRKLLSKKPHFPKDPSMSSRPVSSSAETKEELLHMLGYYRKLLNSWKWIAVFGWVLSLCLLIYARSIVVILPIGLACYSTYALFRCHQAVHLIVTSPSMMERREEGKRLRRQH
ncbi:hypothetical protein [Sporomusa termitida]|uniref:Uncharacterized protein n=1 Tax=Sporomusa termitida TaxID=2377 RepID=A0A517DNR2_9FIRM|nr:hypothetical protein [Sporomusa termitida]QDR78896.1 hypothetical protein SPTER_01460 [Sporomusa termitida]